MADEARKKELQKELGLIQISINNAVTQLNGGKVLQAAVMSDLMARKAVLQAQIAALDDPNIPASEKVTDDKFEIGIPESLRIVRRQYTMSEDAMHQRKSAANSSNKSEGMKGNKNAWKHGQYAQGFIRNFVRPCKSTCDNYPCSLVDDGDTKPGGVCLDKAQIIDTFNAIMQAITEKDDPKRYEALQEIMALKVGSAMQITDMLMEDIMRDGTILKSEIFDKDGKLLGHKIVHHPSLLMLPKLIADLGLTLNDLNVTPRAVLKTEDDGKAVATLATILGKVGKKMQESGGKE